MRIVVTGASGFLGRLLVEELLTARSFGGEPISRLVLVDRVAAGVADALVDVVHGELAERLGTVFAEPVDVLFHLAAAVSAECEADFDLGMRANVDTTRAVLEAARAQAAAGGPVVRVVFASSIAVYGSHPGLPLPELVSETTVPVPRSSYGTQKLMCEHLLADCTRRGFVDGRTVRLMTVAVRPGKPNAAASGFVSGIVREPLAGLPAVCPVDPSLRLALSSPRRTIEGILRVAAAERGTGQGELDGPLPVNLPGLSISVADMLATLREVAGDTVADRVTVAPDPAIEAIVGSWPAAFDYGRAATLGLRPDADFAAVLRDHLAARPGEFRPGSP
ncbi:D-erythronate dehydrogenase [Streptomyces sp. NPDC047072]|uniref:D-erythronate dehydrogenase n=1 Tax=Streptomyces sp. NPDC047072 TaxID=3154809 RepID=UPI00340AD657